VVVLLGGVSRFPGRSMIPPGFDGWTASFAVGPLQKYLI
jgi:hypothetical protein